ncbi:Aminopeptidase YwaD precursor [Brevundimonas sp. SH203]|uniref:M20/M25/M40 family metallo-hydrolase n=1 Tax=Brevundimonas sp. SH203 TaxID=345167 RepID=UPI0009D5EFBE|nr:M20/M25/M40 family metallo-hydrolase [Brevundimonas sp. SH203]GAW42010.1 Aminopeptidase YwaD precursor [Brevundimonas sp. SH203]
MRLILLFTALAVALGLAVVASQTPAPLPISTPADAFSAGRAMADVREIARVPHPVGSEDHARVQTYLMERMTALGLNPHIQTGPLSPRAVQRMAREGRSANGLAAANLVGVLQGRDSGRPAVLMMAHYDSVPGSPGAADDATGVAAILEAVRAIKARGGADRDLIVLLTDAEELNLDGARVFFAAHPWRDRVGAVVNLEARGGGGRAMMFETGPGNAGTIADYARATRGATGGPSSNALAVFVYRSMPNGTDFTVAANRGLAGINLAFIGRPDQYHSPAATPDALDQGSLQHIGSQALEVADVWLRAPALPKATKNAVYADLFGLMVVRHPPMAGWGLLAVAALAAGFAVWRVRRVLGLRLGAVVRGAADGLWLMAGAVVAGQAVRVLAGPVGGRVQSPETYYTLLRRLPVLEIGVVLALSGLALLTIMGRAGGRGVALALVAAAALTTVLGGVDPVVLGAAVVAVGLSLWPHAETETPWEGWLGLIALVLAMGVVVQALAPEAAFLLIWPVLVAAVAAAAAGLISPRLAKGAALIPAALATAGVGGWLLMQGHGVFLGVGMDLPGVLGVIALLVALLARPLAPGSGGGRKAAPRIAGGLAAGGLAVGLGARLIA